MTRRAPGWWSGSATPDPKYAGNRHNVGAMVVDELAVARSAHADHPQGARRRRARSGSARCPAGPPGRAPSSAVPLSYMNESGGPVKALHDVLLRRRPTASSSSTTSSTSRPVTSGSRRAAARAATTACARSARVARHQGLPAGAGRHRPAARAGMDAADFVLARLLRRPSARSCPSCSTTRPTPSRWSSSVGLLDAQQRFHAPR